MSTLKVESPLGLQPRLFNVGEYYHMVKTGILHPDEQVELIQGQVVCMPPQGPAHAGTIRKIIKYLRSLIAPGQADISSAELPVVLGEYDELIPDIAVVRPDLSGRDYYDRHPRPEDILLIIEVAVTSLQYDRATKSRIYAGADICEYWVIDVVGRQLCRFTDPTGGTYLSEVVLSESDSFTLVAFPDLMILSDELFVVSQD